MHLIPTLVDSKCNGGVIIKNGKSWAIYLATGAMPSSEFILCIYMCIVHLHPLHLLPYLLTSLDRQDEIALWIGKGL